MAVRVFLFVLGVVLQIGMTVLFCGVYQDAARDIIKQRITSEY